MAAGKGKPTMKHTQKRWSVSERQSPKPHPWWIWGKGL
nr:MAG TPA: hypothetical protein [Caudoviricetes sp.]